MRSQGQPIRNEQLTKQCLVCTRKIKDRLLLCKEHCYDMPSELQPHRRMGAVKMNAIKQYWHDEVAKGYKCDGYTMKV